MHAHALPPQGRVFVLLCLSAQALAGRQGEPEALAGEKRTHLARDFFRAPFEQGCLWTEGPGVGELAVSFGPEQGERLNLLQIPQE